MRVAALTTDRLGEMFEVIAETEAMCARLADEVRACTTNLAKLTNQWLDQTRVC